MMNGEGKDAGSRIVYEPFPRRGTAGRTSSLMDEKRTDLFRDTLGKLVEEKSAKVVAAVLEPFTKLLKENPFQFFTFMLESNLQFNRDILDADADIIKKLSESGKLTLEQAQQLLEKINQMRTQPQLSGPQSFSSPSPGYYPFSLNYNTEKRMNISDPIIRAGLGLGDAPGSDSSDSSGT